MIELRRQGLSTYEIAALDLPALAASAGYPGTSVIPATSWLLSLLALKLTRTRRVSHADDLLADPAAGLAGLAVLPKKSVLTDYSYRLSHDHQQRFLAALDQKMIGQGLATAGEAIFDLDFHAVMHWGHDPALEKHYVPTRSQRARSVLTFFAQDNRHPRPHLRQRRPVQGHPGTGGDRLLRPPAGRLRERSRDAGHGPEGHHPGRPQRTLSGTARCGPKLRQNSGRVDATTWPAVSATDRRRKSRSPLKPSSRLPGRDLVVVPPPGR